MGKGLSLYCRYGMHSSCHTTHCECPCHTPTLTPPAATPSRPSGTAHTDHRDHPPIGSTNHLQGTDGAAGTVAAPDPMTMAHPLTDASRLTPIGRAHVTIQAVWDNLSTILNVDNPLFPRCPLEGIACDQWLEQCTLESACQSPLFRRESNGSPE